ncbi:MAG: hypothetical protein K0U59_01165, partial [Gammaproteobacteria bacterium]|nr:hypothetical protein [Gammaproteobacteria bacterium]
FFNTAIPIVSSCSSGGTGWVMSVDFATGKAPNFPVFDANNDGAINDGDKGYVGEKFEDFNSAENPDEKNSSNPGILDGGSFIDPGDDGSLNPPNGNPSEITEKLIAIINGNEGDFNIGPGNNQGRLSWEELGR